MRNIDPSPLFHKAIIESGATTARAVYTPTHSLHEQQFREFLALLGAENVPESEIIKDLRKQDIISIVKASEAIYKKYNPSVRWPWQPVIDGEGGMIPRRPIDSLRSGAWRKIPILSGFNTNEGAMFVPKQLKENSQFVDFFHTLLPGLTDDDLATLQEVYADPVAQPNAKFIETRAGVGPQYNRTEQAYGQFAYISPVKQTIHYAVEGGSTSYLYHFAVNSTVKGGADHGSHTRFSTYVDAVRDVSKTLDAVSGSMHAYWTSFITSGNPNTVRGRYPKRLMWPAYTNVGGKIAVFGEGNDEMAGGGHTGVAVKVEDDNYMVKECEFWAARTEKFEM